jgi:hypothetical protein
MLLLIAVIPMLVFPNYQTRSFLAGAKILSLDLSFVNPAQEDVYPNQQYQTKAWISSTILGGILPETSLFKQSDQSCFLSSFPHQKPLILRC